MNTGSRAMDKVAAYHTKLRGRGVKILVEGLHHFFGCEGEGIGKPSQELLQRYGTPSPPRTSASFSAWKTIGSSAVAAP